MDFVSKPIIYALLAVIAAMGTGWGYTKIGLVHETSKYEKEHGDYAEYRATAEANARRAEDERRTLEDRANNAERKTADESAKRDKAHAVELAALSATVAGLRTQLSNAYTAGLAADAARGDVARLTARAATAGQLLTACTGRYGELAERAEQTRLQAVGLYDYIKANPMCSQPFGPAAP